MDSSFAHLGKGGNISTIDEFPWVFCSFSPTRFEVEKKRLASCCNFWCQKDPFLAVAEHALWHTVKAGWSWIVPGTLEINWLHSIEQSSWVLSNENRYLSFLVLLCVTSFSEPSNNMFKLCQGHPSHNVTIPSIFRILRGKGSKFNFCGFFFHRWKLEASEEMGQCCYCWLLKDTKQGLYFTRDRIPKKTKIMYFHPHLRRFVTCRTNGMF